MTSAAARLVKRYRPSIWSDLEACVRFGVRHAWSRAGLNLAYRQLSSAQRDAFHRRFSGIFRDRAETVGPAAWGVRFAGREVRVPLTPERLWLDWDAAVSVLGHEAAIKDTYAAVLASPERPDVFVDVGANYGIHSLLFLVHGVEALSFEPNADCHGFFREICAANGVTPRLEPIALSSEPGLASLRYPEGETWLGTIDTDVANALSHDVLRTREVRQDRLDAFLPTLRPGRMVLKIDAEGSELRVLQGGRQTLATRRPLVLFESWPGSDREALADFLAEAGYVPAPLPWRPGQAGPSLDRRAFLQADTMNFIAVPDAAPIVGQSA